MVSWSHVTQPPKWYLDLFTAQTCADTQTMLRVKSVAICYVCDRCGLKCLGRSDIRVFLPWRFVILITWAAIVMPVALTICFGWRVLSCFYNSFFLCGWNLADFCNSRLHFNLEWKRNVCAEASLVVFDITATRRFLCMFHANGSPLAVHSHRQKFLLWMLN